MTRRRRYNHKGVAYDPYAEGFDDYWNDCGMSDNPHPPGTLDRDLWARGWLDADRENLKWRAA
jgi:hypothetical protein